ncbi:MAG: protein kinase [Planctomycetes bacterium]|nr:protein kinase [Planctomycetota bacterium]
MTEPLSERARQRLLAMAADDAEGAAAPVPARYEIVREIGRGGMGIVYEAIDHQLGRRVALKTFVAGSGATDELRRRLGREALAAARLRHPHIAAVYDATPDHISMQLIAGGAIDAVHRGERRLLVELVRDAARALQHAHEQGVVHRDVKPSNLLVEARHVYVVDFGLAKEIAADSSLSLPGGVVGTPSFMPPEQARGQTAAIDARSDVYGLGATLFACLRGQPPFAAVDLPALLQQVVDAEPPRLAIDRDLDLVVAKCLAKEPAQRYQTAAELAGDLDRWLQQQPVLARRPSLGYRLKKRLQRQRSLWRAAGVAALGTAGLALLVVVPWVLRESAARTAATEAVEVADHAATVLRDAVVFFRLGDNDSAHQVLDDGIRSTREFLSRHEVPRARYLLSRLLRARGKTDAALAELDRAVAGDPQLLDARFERGLLLAAAAPNDATRAQAIADLSVDVGERSVLTAVDRLFGRGQRLRLAGEPEAAMAVLREVLDYDPTHVPARVAMSLAANAAGQQGLGRYYSASAVDFYSGLGPVYLAREHQTMPTTMLGLDGALVDFAPQLLRDREDNALALVQRGLLQLRRALRFAADGDLGAARAAIGSAIGDHDMATTRHDMLRGRSDTLPGALNNRAVCRLVAARLHAQAGDAVAAATERAAAAADLQRALAADGALPEVAFNLGLCDLDLAEVQRAMGQAAAAARGDAAQRWFERALRQAPDGWTFAAACRERLGAAAALVATARR